MAKRVVFSFGRLNPITIGHEVLVNKVASVARSQNAIARIYLSHTQNSNKDPLSYSDKMSFARAAFGNVVIKSNARTVIEIMQSLDKEKFTDVTMIVGSDRVKEFEVLLNKYNDKEYKMNTIAIVSAGERDPDAEGVAGMSASKMRQLAKEKKEKEFIAGAASKMPLLVRKKMYKAVISGLNESVENVMTLDEMFEQLVEADEEGDAELMLSIADAKKMLDDLDVTNLDPHKDDAYFLHVIGREHLDADDPDAVEPQDNVEESADPVDESEQIDEAGVFSASRRMKLSMRMRRMAKRYARIRQIKAKRMAPADRLKYRARKAALMSIRKRIIGKNKKYEDLPRTQKISIDQQIARRFGKKLSARVTMLSTRLLPMIRKKEMERLATARSAPTTQSKTEGDMNKDNLNLSPVGNSTKKTRMFEELFLEARRSVAADQGAEGDLNIIYQLRKVQRLGAAFKVTWTDKTKTPVSIQHAVKAQDMYKKMMNSPGVSGAQKQRFVRKLGKDEKSFMSAIKEDMYYSEDGKNGKCDYCDNAEAHSHKIDDADFAGGKYRKPNMKEALVGGQVKLDKNRNGKLDATDFKSIRKNKTVAEVAVSKAQQHAAGAALAARSGSLLLGGKKGGAIASMASMKTSELRKLAGTSTKNLPMHKEEVEQVDEAVNRAGGGRAHPDARRAALIAKMAKHSPKFAAAMAKPKPAEDKKVEEGMSGGYHTSFHNVTGKIGYIGNKTGAIKHVKSNPDYSLGYGSPGKKVGDIFANRQSLLHWAQLRDRSKTPVKEEHLEGVEEATSDNTDSRLTPKIDMLLRLGLVSADSINRYRAALRGGEKSLANPELRRRLSDLLDRLLDLSTQDPQTFNRMRTTIRDTNPMREAVQSALDTKHDSEQDAMSIRQAREKANAVARNTVSKTVKKELKDEVQLSDSALNNLNEKAIKHNIDIDIILEVYARGINAWSDSSRKLTREQWAFNRVNSFLSGGQTQAVADADLWERASGGGEFGSDELRRNYSNATPGQKEEVILASFSARKPWVGPNEENAIDTGKTPKTYQDIRKAISGIREEG